MQSRGVTARMNSGSMTCVAHPAVRIFLRVLPIAALSTFVFTLLRCKSLYESESRRSDPSWSPEHALDTISTYGALMPHGESSTTFRWGIGAVAVQAVVLISIRLALLLQAQRRANTQRSTCVLIGFSAALASMAVGCLGGVTGVTIMDDDNLHYGLAAAAFGSWLLHQLLEVVALGCCLEFPSTSSSKVRAVLGWGILCIISSAACLVIHQFVSYHPPLQWAGAMLTFAFYLSGGVFGSLFEASSSVDDCASARLHARTAACDPGTATGADANQLPTKNPEKPLTGSIEA